MNLTRALAFVAGAALVAASAALNVASAISTDAEPVVRHAWGAAAVASALGLGLLPRLLLQSVASRRLGTAAVAVTGMLVLGSFNVGNAVKSAAQHRLTAQAAHGQSHESRERAKAELSRIAARLSELPAARPEAVVQAELDTLLSKRRDLNECRGWVPDLRARAICVEAGELRAEQAVSVGRRTLEQDRATLLAKLDKPTATIGNADARAVADMLRLLGIAVEPATIDTLLILIAVLTVELGGGLLIAAAGVSPAVAPARPIQDVIHAPRRPALPNPSQSPENTGDTAGDSHPVEAMHGLIQPLAGGADVVHDLTQPEGRLLALIHDRGEVVAGQRSLAAIAGCSQPTVGRLLRELAGDGKIVVETTPRGTRVMRVG